MNTVYRLLSVIFLLLPVAASAETLPPPGGPYPSTVAADRAPESKLLDENLKFPPPDLVSPAPPPPSLSEELGPGFDAGGNTATTEGAVPSGMAPSSAAPVFPDPSASYAPTYPEGGYPGAAGGAGADGQWPSTQQGVTAYPPSSIPGTAGATPPPGVAYPGYGYSYGYPYGYAQQPGYGYGYPGAGYGPNNQWDERMNTPFGDMPSPWGSMPRSFFPGR